MKNSKIAEEDWLIKADSLLEEMSASEKAYASFIQADIYPHKRPFFQKCYRQRAAFSSVLRAEFIVIGHYKNARWTGRPDLIFRPMQSQMLEGNLSSWEVDALIVEKEQQLITLYQELLYYQLPNVTLAILQSQAELLNDGLQGLKLELKERTRKEMENAPVML